MADTHFQWICDCDCDRDDTLAVLCFTVCTSMQHIRDNSRYATDRKSAQLKMKKGAKIDANAVFNATLAPGVSNHGR